MNVPKGFHVPFVPLDIVSNCNEAKRGCVFRFIVFLLLILLLV